LNRSAISADMFQSLRDDLEQNHALLNSFQLLDITLPAAFASAIQTTEITRQQISTAQFQKERALVESATQVLAASQQAQVITARASADSQVILAQAQAQAAAINSRTTNLLNAYLTIKSNYSMTEDELLSYIWLQALSETQASVTYSYRKPGSLNY
jgi:regulator of protease activity HflC (stomatin/prohibitin superfamily)